MSVKDRKRFMQNLFYVSYINASASAITADELVRFSRLEQLFNESQSLLRKRFEIVIKFDKQVFFKTMAVPQLRRVVTS